MGKLTPIVTMIGDALFRKQTFRSLFVALIGAVLFLLLAFVVPLHDAAPLEIGVIGNSGDSPETYAAIEFFVKKRVDLINRQGGINGRKVAALFRDNGGDNDLAVEQVSDLVERDNLIALIGIWNSSRAARVMPIIEQADIPLIGYFSDTSIYRDATELYAYKDAAGRCEDGGSPEDCAKRVKDHPGIYTGLISLNDESDAFKRRLAQADIRSVIYLGQEYDRYSAEYLKGLIEMDCSGLIDSLNVFTVSTKAGPGEIKAWTQPRMCSELVPDVAFDSTSVDSDERRAFLTELLRTQLAATPVDLLVISLGSSENADLVAALSNHHDNLIIYSALGDIGNIIGNLEQEARDHKGIELWDTADQGIPHANNQRLEELYYNSRDELADLLVTKNVIGFGGIYSDLAAMLAEAARSGEEIDPVSVRKNIIKGMRDYRQGGKIFQGWAQDWWFTIDRSAARDSRLAWSPNGRSTYVLDPVQFTFVNRKLVLAEVLYTSIDVIEFRGLDDKDGEVDVEFYLGLKKAIHDGDVEPRMLSTITCDDPAPASGLSGGGSVPRADTRPARKLIDHISFPNAAKSKMSQAPLIDYRRISRDVEESDGFVFCNELYQVSGRFSFQPDLRRYPFDQQTIRISIQASDNEKPILIQPLASELQDKEFRSQNWRWVQHYVGVDQDIIKSLSGYGENVQVIPFYKFNFTWVMEREIVDYFLKVLVPVLVIILITYASVYIPDRHFEAEAGIQVTCLLASIALYFSIDKPSTPYATLSDWVFVATYITITSMMVMSVTRAVVTARNLWGLHVVKPLQFIGYPIWVLVLISLFYNSTAASL